MRSSRAGCSTADTSTPTGCGQGHPPHADLAPRPPARVFNREEVAFAAVYSGRIKPGDTVVIRYEGPRGGPGMREMLQVTAAIVGEPYPGRAGRGRCGAAPEPHYRRGVLARYATLVGSASEGAILRL